MAGPGLAALCIQVLTAPIALVLDVASFVASAAFLGRLRVIEQPPPADEQTHLWREIREGLQIVVYNSLLRPIALASLTMNLFGGAFGLARVQRGRQHHL